MASKPCALLVGLDPDTETLLEPALRVAEIIRMDLDLEKLMEPLPESVNLILVKCEDAPLTLEIAQSRRMQHSFPIFHISTTPGSFNKKDFLKNGFTDSFLLPMDTHSMVLFLKEALSHLGSELVVLKKVSLVDVDAGEALDFDTSVYLQANNKYIKISNAGEELDADRLARIKKSKLNKTANIETTTKSALLAPIDSETFLLLYLLYFITDLH